MGDPRHELGLRAERAVGSWLEASGWEILDRRWRGPSGELDLVCRDADRVLVAVEVKVRTTGRAGSGAESLSRRQLVRLRASVGQYAASHAARGSAIRVDLVEVAHGTGDDWQMRRLPGVGSW